MVWLKYTLYTLLVLFAACALFIYLYLKSLGIIPREDYDTQPPVLPDIQQPAVLIFNKTNGFIHEEAIPAADNMLKTLAEQQGWGVYITDNAAVHNVEQLKKFKLIVWNNVSGDVLTLDQRVAFKQWIEQGGGWVGLHAAGGDISYKWGWYGKTLIGAQFVGHTMNPQFQDADLIKTAPDSTLTQHLPVRWRVEQEEWYAFDRNPRDLGYDIELVIDKDSYKTSGKTFFGMDEMQGEHPLSWRHSIGSGRAFYSAIGHRAATYDNPDYRQLIANAMQWAMNESN